MNEDSKQFRDLYNRIPKNAAGEVDAIDLFRAFRIIIGVDLLSFERFQAAKNRQFPNKQSFAYEESESLFKEIDNYLETLPVFIPRRSRSLSASFTRVIDRIRGRPTINETDHIDPTQYLNGGNTIHLPEPATPPLTDRVNSLDARLDHMDSKLSQLESTQKMILSKLKL
jgi:hypothetical protein